MTPLKILVLIGSPRNEESWTYKSIRMLEERMLEIQPCDFEYVFLQKVGVPMCDGCLKCVNVGESACPEYETIGPIRAYSGQACSPTFTQDRQPSQKGTPVFWMKTYSTSVGRMACMRSSIRRMIFQVQLSSLRGEPTKASTRSG